MKPLNSFSIPYGYGKILIIYWARWGVGEGVHIMDLCKILLGVYSTVLSETLLQIFDFCCSKEQNTVYFTHSQTHPW